MKRYIRSSTYLDFNGNRYGWYEDNGVYQVYDNDLNKLQPDKLSYNEVITQIDKLNKSSTRQNLLLTEFYRYCKARTSSRYELHPNYMQFIPNDSSKGSYEVKKKLESFKKSNPQCKLVIRSNSNNEYFIYEPA